MKIRSIGAFQIYDSRGNPTVEVEVGLENGMRGRGLVPSGASIGQFEAVELRDADRKRWRGKSVQRAIDNIPSRDRGGGIFRPINTPIFERLPVEQELPTGSFFRASELIVGGGCDGDAGSENQECEKGAGFHEALS